MFDQARLVGVRLRAVIAAVLISPVVVFHDQMLVQSTATKRIILNNSHKRQSIILMILVGVPCGDYLCEFCQV